MKQTVKVIDFDKPNKNGRIYPKEAFFDLNLPYIVYCFDKNKGLRYDLKSAVGVIHSCDNKMDGLYVTVDFSTILPMYPYISKSLNMASLKMTPNGTEYVDEKGNVKDYKLHSFSLQLNE